MDGLTSRRFLFITGKGGVGKTTVTAALALHLSQRGRRVLVAMPGPKERLSQLLGAPALNTQIALLRPNLWGVLLVPEAALREYGVLVLKSRRIVEGIFDNRMVQGFLNGAPGLREWSLLGKAWYHSTEIAADGAPRFDTVIFDAPATGHGLEMLRVPKVIVELAPPGILRRDAERAWRMFQDPVQSGVLLVTLPEEMPVNETLELAAAVKSELGLPTAGLVVNAVLPQLFKPEERQSLAALGDSFDGTAYPGDIALRAAQRRSAREQIQEASLARLQTLGLPSLQLPYWRAGALDLRAITAFSAVFG